MISKKCYYALRAMLELSVREGQGPVTINQIARRQNIPPRFLEAILRQLKQAGYTQSIRGKEGGYILGQEAKDIPVGPVVRLFEGPLISSNSNSNSPLSNPTRPDVFSDVWTEAESSLSGVLDAVSFGELAQKERLISGRFIQDYTI